MNFESWLRCIGLIPQDITPGKWIRCSTENHPRKKNGCYKLADSGTIGWGIDWATMTESATWTADDDKAIVVDRKQIAIRQDNARQEQAKAIMAAQAYYAACKPLADLHPYLRAKGFETPVQGLRIDRDGNLIVPMGQSIQKIMPDGDKRFWPGAPTKGARFLIPHHHPTITILCEGLATGMTLYEAVQNSQVIVCFNAGNLPVVANTLQAKGLVVVAADNDHGTQANIGKNPGVDSATKAAAHIGCGVAIPQCVGTDWNDYATEQMRYKESGGFRRKTQSQMRQEIYADIRTQVMKQARFISSGCSSSSQTSAVRRSLAFR